MRDVIQDDYKAKRIVEQGLNINIAMPFSGLVLHDDGELIGAVTFSHYDGIDCIFTCVLVKPDVGMRIVRRVTWFVFGVMKCRRCTAWTARSNLKAITALETLGFRFEGVWRERMPNGEDGLLYGLLRSEQRMMRALQ